MKRNLFYGAICVVVFLVQISQAQLKIDSGGRVGIGTEDDYISKLQVVDWVTEEEVLRVEYTNYNNDVDVKAVYGKSVPRPYYGIGGLFYGGWIGLYARSTISGEGDRYGIRTYAYNGEDTNYGIYAYGRGGETSYAGYFSGNVHVTGTITQGSDMSLKERTSIPWVLFCPN